MNIWLVMLILGLITFVTRFSFIALLDRVRMPKFFQKALRFVPIAVLTAIIVPSLSYYNNALSLSPNNPRLLAGIIATLVAFKTRSVLWTIFVGMAIFWVLRIWL